MRSYTVGELNDLREAVRSKLIFGCYNVRPGSVSMQFIESDLIKNVEKQVQTHMIAGHTAHDLYESEQG